MRSIDDSTPRCQDRPGAPSVLGDVLQLELRWQMEVYLHGDKRFVLPAAVLNCTSISGP